MPISRVIHRFLQFFFLFFVSYALTRCYDILFLSISLFGVCRNFISLRITSRVYRSRFTSRRSFLTVSPLPNLPFSLFHPESALFSAFFSFFCLQSPLLALSSPLENFIYPVLVLVILHFISLSASLFSKL